jgi:hypothetical protein
VELSLFTRNITVKWEKIRTKFKNTAALIIFVVSRENVPNLEENVTQLDFQQLQKQSRNVTGKSLETLKKKFVALGLLLAKDWNAPNQTKFANPLESTQSTWRNTNAPFLLIQDKNIHPRENNVVTGLNNVLELNAHKKEERLVTGKDLFIKNTSKLSPNTKFVDLIKKEKDVTSVKKLLFVWNNQKIQNVIHKLKFVTFATLKESLVFLLDHVSLFTSNTPLLSNKKDQMSLKNTNVSGNQSAKNTFARKPKQNVIGKVLKFKKSPRRNVKDTSWKEDKKERDVVSKFPCVTSKLFSVKHSAENVTLLEESFFTKFTDIAREFVMLTDPTETKLFTEENVVSSRRDAFKEFALLFPRNAKLKVQSQKLFITRNVNGNSSNNQILNFLQNKDVALTGQMFAVETNANNMIWKQDVEDQKLK